MRSIAIVIGVVLLLPALARANPARPTPGPEQVVERGIAEVMAILRDPTMQKTRATRVARLRAVADGIFDWEEMSRRSLGAYWRTLDATQRQRFVAVLPDILASAQLEDLDRFRGDERVVIDRTVVERGGEVARVETTVITHSRERVPMVYWLYTTNARWRVYDFSIEGVSMVNHHRESFARFLVNHDFAALIERLESKR